MCKHHDSLLFMVVYRQALDRLCVRLNMYLVIKDNHVDAYAVEYRVWFTQISSVYVFCQTARQVFMCRCVCTACAPNCQKCSSGNPCIECFDGYEYNVGETQCEGQIFLYSFTLHFSRFIITPNTFNVVVDVLSAFCVLLFMSMLAFNVHFQSYKQMHL